MSGGAGQGQVHYNPGIGENSVPEGIGKALGDRPCGSGLASSRERWNSISEYVCIELVEMGLPVSVKNRHLNGGMLESGIPISEEIGEKTAILGGTVWLWAGRP